MDMTTKERIIAVILAVAAAVCMYLDLSNL
jgi:hypothetical protein